MRYMPIAKLGGCCVLGADPSDPLQVAVEQAAGKGAYAAMSVEQVREQIEHATANLVAGSEQSREAKALMLAQLVPPAIGRVSVYLGTVKKSGGIASLDRTPRPYADTTNSWSRPIRVRDDEINRLHDSNKAWPAIVAVYVPRGFVVKVGAVVARQTASNETPPKSRTFHGPTWAVLAPNTAPLVEAGAMFTGPRGISWQHLLVTDQRTQEEREADELHRQAGGIREVAGGAHATQDAAASMPEFTPEAQAGMSEYEKWQLAMAQQQATVEAQTEAMQALAQAQAQQQAREQWQAQQQAQQRPLPRWLVPVGVGAGALAFGAVVLAVARR